MYRAHAPRCSLCAPRSARHAILNRPERSGPGQEKLRREIRAELGVARATLDLRVVKIGVLLVALAVVLNNAVALALR